MNNILVITDKEKLYDKCENMEQLFDKYYLPLLDKHYSKVYQLQQENQELKKRLEINSKINIADHKYASECEGKVIILESQQKEFIEYLTDYINILREQGENVEGLDIAEEHILMVLEENLQKYKEIIGEGNENN